MKSQIMHTPNDSTNTVDLQKLAEAVLALHNLVMALTRNWGK